MFDNYYQVWRVSLNDSNLCDVLRIPLDSSCVGGLHLKNFRDVALYHAFQVRIFNLKWNIFFI